MVVHLHCAMSMLCGIRELEQAWLRKAVLVWRQLVSPSGNRTS
jgi:hypothetical protein